MVFEILFIVGFGGMVLMALFGSVRFGHHAAGSRAGRSVSLKESHAPVAHGHVTHSPGGYVHHGAHAHVGHAGHGHAGGHVHNSQQEQTLAQAPVSAIHHRHFNLWSLIPSPFDFFSFCFGAGAVGLLLQGHMAPATVKLLAVVGAVVFCFGITRPAFALMLKFASAASEGLEGTVALTAEAITKFDDKGQGLVCVNMEGQLVQLLGRLSSDDISHGVQVKKGEQVVVTEVDSKRGICTVTRELTI